MEDEPFNLDSRRTNAGRMASDMRRHAIRESEADQQPARQRQREMEAQLLAGEAHTWPEVAAKAEYLLRLYAETPEAQDARLSSLIERALADINRLLDNHER